MASPGGLRTLAQDFCAAYVIVPPAPGDGRNHLPWSERSVAPVSLFEPNLCTRKPLIGLAYAQRSKVLNCNAEESRNSAYEKSEKANDLRVSREEDKLNWRPFRLPGCRRRDVKSASDCVERKCSPHQLEGDILALDPRLWPCFS
jgi:hypothetical protein